MSDTFEQHLKLIKLCYNLDVSNGLFIVFIEQSIETTIEWYRAFYEDSKILSEMQLNTYIKACNG